MAGRSPLSLDVAMNIWRRLLGLLWLLVAGAFVWAIIDLGNVIGGLRWLDHVGASAATAMYAAAAILALLVAVNLLRNGNVVVIAAVAVGLLGFAIVSTLVLPIPGLRLLRPPRLVRMDHCTGPLVTDGCRDFSNERKVDQGA